jgi:hypothetical protein
VVFQDKLIFAVEAVKLINLDTWRMVDLPKSQLIKKHQPEFLVILYLG